MAIWRKDKKCFNFLILLDTLFFKVFFFALYDYFEGSNLDFCVMNQIKPNLEMTNALFCVIFAGHI